LAVIAVVKVRKDADPIKVAKRDALEFIVPPFAAQNSAGVAILTAQQAPFPGNSVLRAPRESKESV
jgi:hypothetical protein